MEPVDAHHLFDFCCRRLLRSESDGPTFPHAPLQDSLGMIQMMAKPCARSAMCNAPLQDDDHSLVIAIIMMMTRESFFLLLLLPHRGNADH